MFFALVLVLMIPTIYSVFAQNDIENITDKKETMVKLEQLDNLMSPVMTATLTGLSLTGASFLVNILRNINETTESDHINSAKKHFIRAFFMFIICTVALLIFDFLQVLDARTARELIILDVAITYTFFGIGVVYLVNAARHMRFTYGK
jgi:hypothetical protein